MRKDRALDVRATVKRSGSMARGGIKIDAVFPRYLRNTGGRDDAPDMTKRTIAGPRTVTVGLYLI